MHEHVSPPPPPELPEIVLAPPLTEAPLKNGLLPSQLVASLIRELVSPPPQESPERYPAHPQTETPLENELVPS